MLIKKSCTKTAVAAILLLTALPQGHAADTLLWQLGKADDNSNEFGDYRRADPEKVTLPSGSTSIENCNEISKGLKASLNPSMEIGYTLPAVPEHGAMFSFKLLHAPKGGSQMGVFSNGNMAGLIQLWGTEGTSSPYHWKKTYRLYIPAEFLLAGANVLRLSAPRPIWSDASVDPHMWWEWDFIRLEALSAPAREPVHGSVSYLGTTMKNSANDFNVNDDTLHVAPLAFKWAGIAFSGNTIRADFWYDVSGSQPRRLEYLQLLRDLNMSVIVDHLSGSHYKLAPDGKMTAKTRGDLAAFFAKYGQLFQWYEIGNEPCMFGGGYNETMELANVINEIKPRHVKTTAPGWAYGGGKGTPKNWDADVVKRRTVEALCQATNGHSYGFSYADNKGGSFVENLATFEGVKDGWPKEYVNTETGTNNWHSEENGPRYASTQPNAQAFDRILRAHLAVVDRTMQHAAIFDDFGLFKAPSPWSAPMTLSAFPGTKGQDTRLKTYRRLALAYATHGAPLPYTVLNKDALAGKLVYFRALDTASLPGLPGSAGTADKILLNFVNFENSPQTLKIKVKLPISAVYSGELFGPGESYSEARVEVKELKADPYLELSADLGAGGSVQYILSTPAPRRPYSPLGLNAIPGEKQIALEWSGSAGATSYAVERALKEEGPYTRISGTLKETHYSDENLENRAAYFYRVLAANDTGESSVSEPVNAPAGK